MKVLRLLVITGVLIAGYLFLTSSGRSLLFKLTNRPGATVKLYWFIPDGVRAEPGLFNIFKWAEEGKLPNIKKLMDKGSYGFAKPNFPSHTPTNFATLLTGAYPEVHGVNDGPMRAIGKPLNSVAVPGFRSSAKKVEPIWTTLERQGFKVALVSVPGSTPPEIQKGVVLRGRWGGWGADFFALNFEMKGNLSQRISQGTAARLFYFGPQLTQYVDPGLPQGWQNPPQSLSPAYEVTLNGWGVDVYAYVFDGSDDKKRNYDSVAFSLDKKQIFATLKQGQWSEWQPVTLKWSVEGKTIDVSSDLKITVIKLGDDNFFRFRVLYNNLNREIAFPPESADEMEAQAGPMVDFADNFPPQLIYYPEDKNTFLEESTMSFEWHKLAVGAVVRKFLPEAIIHDIYTPNQMLTSRWWMSYIDPDSSRYQDVTDKEREKLWDEVEDMYRMLDDIVGEMLKNTGPDTYLVISSDHGAVPLDRNVHLNNLFAKKGWLKFTINPQTGESVVDWKNTKVIYLQMAHVFINPAGLAGNYERASGPRYERLREEVRQALATLEDDNGTKPAVDIVNWEDARVYMKLDPSRIGDLVIANAPGYGWIEKMSNDLKVFSTPLVSGYKQAIKADEVTGMWTPFIIAGPGIKPRNYLGDKPHDLIDEYPTIMTALKVKIPEFVQGQPLPVFK